MEVDCISRLKNLLGGVQDASGSVEQAILAHGKWHHPLRVVHENAFKRMIPVGIKSDFCPADVLR